MSNTYQALKRARMDKNYINPILSDIANANDILTGLRDVPMLDLDEETDWRIMESVKCLDRARRSAEELVNMVPEEHELILAQYNTGVKDFSTLVADEYTIKKEGTVIHVIANFRCPNIRAISLDFRKKSKEIRMNFVVRAMEQCSEIKKMSKCYMVFVHHYIDSPLYERDADNYYEKPLSDGIADVFIEGGDGPKNIRRVSVGVPDKSNFTEVFLIPFDDFPSWISDFDAE